MDKSHRLISKHPNAHTDIEIKWIKDLLKRNSHIILCELWIKLKRNKGYTRHIVKRPKKRKDCVQTTCLTSF